MSEVATITGADVEVPLRMFEDILTVASRQSPELEIATIVALGVVYAKALKVGRARGADIEKYVRELSGDSGV